MSEYNITFDGDILSEQRTLSVSGKMNIREIVSKYFTDFSNVDNIINDYAFFIKDGDDYNEIDKDKPIEEIFIFKSAMVFIIEMYCVTFIHPTDGSTLTANVWSDMKIDELIEALISEGFIEKKDEYCDYTFSASNGVFISGRLEENKKTLKESGILHNTTLYVGTNALYGCPTAKDVYGLVPDCMLVKYSSVRYVDY